MPAHFDIEIDENNFRENILKMLREIHSDWNEAEVKFKTFNEGTTNKIIGAYCHSQRDMILFRVNGNNSDSLVDRVNELKMMKFLKKFNFAPEIYATFVNGIAYEFVPGAILTTENVFETKIWKLVAKKMAQLHKVLLNVDEKLDEPMIKKVGLKYLDLIPETFADAGKNEKIAQIFPSKADLTAEFHQLLDKIESTKSPLVICHNDLLLSNIIFDSSCNKISFIDFEYAGLNYQYFDIANHFVKMCGGSSDSRIDYSTFPSDNFQLEWLKCYLSELNDGQQVAEAVLKDVKIFVAASHLLWTCWCLLQAEYSAIDFDFVKLGQTYFNEYLFRKTKI